MRNLDMNRYSSAICLPLLVSLLIFPSIVFAHREDEYLQATFVAIEPDSIRLEINLTPGIAIAEQVIKLIDRDHDGVISAKETAAYAESLQRDLTLRLDRRTLALKITASESAEAATLRTGSGIIQIEFTAVPGMLAPGAHKLTLENRHQRKISVYLINAARPSSSAVQITRQSRNNNQSTGEIELRFQPLH